MSRLHITESVVEICLCLVVDCVSDLHRLKFEVAMFVLIHIHLRHCVRHETFIDQGRFRQRVTPCDLILELPKVIRNFLIDKLIFLFVSELYELVVDFLYRVFLAVMKLLQTCNSVQEFLDLRI